MQTANKASREAQNNDVASDVCEGKSLVMQWRYGHKYGHHMSVSKYSTALSSGGTHTVSH